MKTILIASSKGGIGKSTTSVCLNSILNQMEVKEGKKTRKIKSLLIDTDMQCNSTDTYRAAYEGETTLYDVIFEDATLEEAIQHTEAGDIVAGDPLLREAEIKMGSDVSKIGVLRKKIKELKEYDYVILDSGPSISNLLFSDILAADVIVIPATTDRYAVQGLTELKKTIDKVNDTFCKETQIAGILVIKYSGRTNVEKGVLESLNMYAEQIGTKVFDTKIRETTKLREAQIMRQTLIEYAPKSNTAIDYETWAKELIGGIK